MIDFHCHILPNLDDGATTVDDSMLMAKSLSAFGYKSVCCTPHCIKGYYDLTPQKIREATLMLQADLDNSGINLDLWPGTEYMLDDCFAEFAEDLQPLGNTKLILCEAPPQGHPGIVQQGLELIIEKGFVPLIAHPERTEYFYEILSQRVVGGASRKKTEEQADSGFEDSVSPPSTRYTPLAIIKRLFALRATRHAPHGTRHAPPATRHPLPEVCLFQANLGSFTGYYGEQVQRRAYELLKAGVYTALASDLHDCRSSAHILVSDKITFNPYLKKLSEFDGTIGNPGDGKVDRGQGELF